jgi:Flp pilus assembly protein protease CpaA
MTSFRRLSHAGADRKNWIWIGVAAVPAIRLYYVQEMIAALIMFSVLFVGAATVVLIIFLLDRASQQVVAWAEAGVARMVHRDKGACPGDI